MEQHKAITTPAGDWREEIAATLTLAYPLVLTNIASALIHATDVVLLGRLGARSLAAATLGVNLINACIFFGTGVVTAAAPMIARELGARAHSVREVRRTVRQAIWAAVALCLPLWALLWQAEALLLAMGQDPALSADAASMVRPMMFGLLPLFLFLVLRSFVSALERPIWALVIGAGAVIFNAVVNYALIFGYGLGLFGAGVGSALSNLAMFCGLALVVVRNRRFRRYRLFGHAWRADWPRFRAIWRLGLPIALTLLFEVTIFNAAAFLMGLIGTEELAAHAVAIQISALSFMVPLGLSQAVTVRVGLALGRGDPRAVARAGWTSWWLGVGFMAATALALITVPRPLVGLFLDLADPANTRTVALAVSFLGIAALFQLVDGAQAVGAGMLRGLHDATIPMIIALFGYWIVGFGVGVPLAFQLGWGGLGVWVGLAAGLAVVAVLLTARWMLRDRLGMVAGPR